MRHDTFLKYTRLHILFHHGASGGQVIGTFISHPANVNGDGSATPVDILRLIDSLNGVFTPPWGIYSKDIDRSNAATPSDILREIDLLNGAGEFDPWNNVPLPSGTCNP